MHGRNPPSPANTESGVMIIQKDKTMSAATLEAFMAIPQTMAFYRPTKSDSPTN
jgi:hypothetical protein